MDPTRFLVSSETCGTLSRIIRESVVKVLLVLVMVWLFSGVEEHRVVALYLNIF